MGDFHVSVGDEVHFRKTVSESDVYLFAGITGDFSPNHVDAQTMAGSAFGERIAHGALIVGFMSTTSTLMVRQSEAGTPARETAVSLGYDRVRFLAPVFLGDTLSLTYRIAEIDAGARRSRAEITARNQHGDEVAVATHILKWVEANRA